MHVVPGFWEWLDLQMDGGSVGSIGPIAQELVTGSDELADWARERTHRVLSVDDDATQNAFADIANYVMTHPTFAEPYRTTFLDGADPWLIAKAAATGSRVVTHESKVAADSTKVKVPNVCEAFGVSCLDAYDLLDTLGARLVLDR